VEAQARGSVNRNLQQTTTTGGATMQFDLPGYLGGSAQRTLMANGIIHSEMTVKIAQAPNGAPLLMEGSSLLYVRKECDPGGKKPEK
jgi:hypothetical protein